MQHTGSVNKFKKLFYNQYESQPETFFEAMIKISVTCPRRSVLRYTHTHYFERTRTPTHTDYVAS